MTFDSTLPLRRLIVSILYLISAVFFVSNFIVLGTAGFGVIDVFLLVGGVSMWVLAGTHSAYNRSIELKKKDQAPRFIKSSTHSAINAALYSTSAIFFVAADAYQSQTLDVIRGPRLAGSSLWLLSALTYLWLSWYEKKQEDNPDAIIKPLGIHPEVFHFVNESEYLFAGVLYAAAIYLTEPIPILKAAGNVCWLLASSHEVLRTFQGLLAAKKEVGASEKPEFNSPIKITI